MAAVDVLIPVYNAAATLDASLASLAAQTLTDIRILVVDDGSTDDSPALLAAWAARDPRFEIVRQDNGGVVRALNAGLAIADAPLLARLDADDIAFPERLALQKDYLDANADCIAVGCGVEHIDETGAPLPGLPHPGSPEDADFDRAPALEPYIIHPFLMVRRDAIARVGGYRFVPQSEDSDLYWRLMVSGRLFNLGAILGQYRVHERSLSSRSVASGRVMAVGSQLGALSARRRNAGKADIVFAPELLGQLSAAQTLEAMCARAESLLDTDEAPRLRLMAGVKLMELAGYRPYEIEMSDCVFIRAGLVQAHLFSKDNSRNIRWHIVETARRLLREGHMSEALALTPPAYYPRAIAKALLSR